MDVFIEPIEPSPRAVRHRRRPRRLSPRRGSRTTVGLPRARRRRPREVREPRALPGRRRVIVDDIPQWAATRRLPASAYVVIVTRGHTHDLDALRSLAGARPALPRPDRQPRQGRAHLRRAARRRACSPDWLRSVHAPDRPRHRRRHARRDRRQHPRRADRRPARQGGRAGVGALAPVGGAHPEDGRVEVVAASESERPPADAGTRTVAGPALERAPARRSGPCIMDLALSQDDC